MRMRVWSGLVLGTLLLSGVSAKAEFITYLTTGTFDSGGTPGTPTYTSTTDPSTTVTFTSTLSTVDAPPPPGTQASFGTFTTASGAVTPTGVSSGFTMVILNTATSDSITFTGTLGGAISSSMSSAFVQFAGPLSQVLDGFTFAISSADNGVAGRINLSAPTANAGVTTVNGNISFVPEPSTLALLGIGAPALVGMVLRRRNKAAKA